MKCDQFTRRLQKPAWSPSEFALEQLNLDGRLKRQQLSMLNQFSDRIRKRP